MFQQFLRTRAQGFLKARAGDAAFKARGTERDDETDRVRVDAVFQAIESALKGAEAEYAGLGRRVEDVLARAAVTLGNDTDEYLHRESLDNHHLDLFDTEIFNGQRRLQSLVISIAHLKALKAELLTRFPNVKIDAAKS